MKFDGNETGCIIIHSHEHAVDETYDKQGNYFCVECGAGVDVKPQQCKKCVGSSVFLSVGWRWYGAEIKTRKKMNAVKRGMIKKSGGDYEQVKDEDELALVGVVV